MKQKEKILENGIKVHLIKTDLFKTDLSVIFMIVPLKRDTVTKNALIPAVLRSGCRSFKNQNEINKELEMMYGATFDCGLDKTGDNLILKFYIESVNDNFLPGENENLKKAINLLTEIAFNPEIQNGSFVKEYVDTEKNNLQILIDAQKDEKDSYSLERCINVMYGDNGFGLSKLGYVEDFEKIDEKNLYEYFLELLRTAKIDIYISGDFNEDEVLEQIENIGAIKSINNREEDFTKNDFVKEKKEQVESINEVSESMDVAQGKLVIGVDILPNDLGDYRFVALMYNTILGDGANSKLFQNVREKEGLAYTTKSNYVVQKNNIFLRCGIEIENYDKAVSIIKEQLEEMKKGNFTEEDIESAKKYIISGIKAIDSEQDTGIIYLLGEELSPFPVTPEEYREKIESITKEDIVNFAQNININTIYFLKS